MDRKGYAKYRMRCGLFVILWILVSAVSITFWSAIPLFIKTIVVILGFIFQPGLEMVEQLFMSFDRYDKEGLW